MRWANEDQIVDELIDRIRNSRVNHWQKEKIIKAIGFDYIDNYLDKIGYKNKLHDKCNTNEEADEARL